MTRVLYICKKLRASFKGASQISQKGICVKLSQLAKPPMQLDDMSTGKFFGPLRYLTFPTGLHEN